MRGVGKEQTNPSSFKSEGKTGSSGSPVQRRRNILAVIFVVGFARIGRVPRKGSRVEVKRSSRLIYVGEEVQSGMARKKRWIVDCGQTGSVCTHQSRPSELIEEVG